MNNIYSIPASLPFSDILAGWILELYGQKPEQLPRVLVLLPSRRACLALREAFLRLTSGHATLLPRMQPLGDVEESWNMPVEATSDEYFHEPQPCFAYKRVFLIAQLVRTYQSNVQNKHERMDHALHQAHEIAQLLDKVTRDGASLANIAELVPDEFSEHWQLTTEFLSIIAEHWPAIARQANLISPEEWRAHQLTWLAQHWKKSPPEYPVIAAGTTGSIFSTAQLLKTINNLPEGRIVLPGFDTGMDEAYIAALTESHPQWGMAHLLRELKVEPSAVLTMGEPTTQGLARTKLLSRALCPAELLALWQEPFAELAQATSGLHSIACDTLQQEAQVVALLLREVLETPARTAALVTHDRALARRVAAEMQRYGITIDDSAGQNLSTTPSAVYLRLLLDVAVTQASPIALLSWLKHPLTTANMDRITCLEMTRRLESAVMRGLCPARGLTGLKASLKQQSATDHGELIDFIDRLAEHLAPLLSEFARSGSDEFLLLLDLHIGAAMALAGEAFKQAAEYKTLTQTLEHMRSAAAEAGTIEMASYPRIFELLLSRAVVRPDYGTHPRLKILSPLEARLQSFDRMILGGLNEGTWPPAPMSDPWFNSSMRDAVGLERPEKMVGLAAHDFTVCASAPEVFLTRSCKVDGAPASAARWWVRMEAWLQSLGLDIAAAAQHYIDWAKQLDEAADVAPCARPTPAPPVAARPRELAVTQVDTWLTNPYMFYARNILKLRKLKAIDEDPTAADFGMLLHAALEDFVRDYPADLPPDIQDTILRYGKKRSAAILPYYPVAAVWWWPRLEQIAQWFAGQEQHVRQEAAKVYGEIKGAMELDGMRFTARADRIEQLKSGGVAIVDYKTGRNFTKIEVERGETIQLMMLALMAQTGKWNAEIAQQAVQRLEYWIASGGGHEGEVMAVKSDIIAERAEDIRTRLQQLIATYQNPAFAYHCPVFDDSEHDDYAHLARVQEWS